tara:strand:- start:158 stop:478 length:321 start_codon:yes stop_codon:yes gene_type:complete
MFISLSQSISNLLSLGFIDFFVTVTVIYVVPRPHPVQEEIVMIAIVDVVVILAVAADVLLLLVLFFAVDSVFVVVATAPSAPLFLAIFSHYFSYYSFSPVRTYSAV